MGEGNVSSWNGLETLMFLVNRYLGNIQGRTLHFLEEYTFKLGTHRKKFKYTIYDIPPWRSGGYSILMQATVKSSSKLHSD